MIMRRWPLEDMNILRKQINRIFEPCQTDSEYLIPVEVAEKQEEYQVRLMVPGIEPKLISLEATQRELIIRAECQPRELERDENVHLSDFPYGKFIRHLSFPLAINPEKIEAVYELGILNVKVPKTEAAQRKTIEVKVQQV